MYEINSIQHMNENKSNNFEYFIANTNNNNKTNTIKKNNNNINNNNNNNSTKILESSKHLSIKSLPQLYQQHPSSQGHLLYQIPNQQQRQTEHNIHQPSSLSQNKNFYSNSQQTIIIDLKQQNQQSDNIKDTVIHQKDHQSQYQQIKQNKETSSKDEKISENKSIMLFLKRRRIFQRHSCLISILLAFSLGLILGVLIPILTSLKANNFLIKSSVNLNKTNNNDNNIINNINLYSNKNQLNNINNKINYESKHSVSNFPTTSGVKYDNKNNNNKIDGIDIMSDSDTISVSFVNNDNNNFADSKKLPIDEVFRNAFHLEQDSDNTMIVKKLDSNDGSIKEFRVELTSDGMYRKGPEKLISKPSLIDYAQSNSNKLSSVNVPSKDKNSSSPLSSSLIPFIKNDIYWNEFVENLLPSGFSDNDALQWNQYVQKKAKVRNLESGCGRMQNRLVIFDDGTQACARYRQNTDQIQGELFSFYLGQLLNLTNLAPSAAAVIDLEQELWSNAEADIQQSQWKSQRPVVLTKWLTNLEPAGIPMVFQPMERHLNKYDILNITLGILQKEQSINDKKDDTTKNNKNNNNNINNLKTDYHSKNKQKGLVEKLMLINDYQYHQSIYNKNNVQLINRLIELAQWSDLIVFDYLIANLDRVVNNLYNYQWNSDIMAAPAHNLAKQTNSQLLVFLDNESGLLHGYRLLKKYEAYHGLLLDNLCIFRQPTIDALRNLRNYGIGLKLNELFEKSTSHQLRDVLPSLPDKSIKILIDRIDRVLGQVQKCHDLFSGR